MSWQILITISILSSVSSTLLHRYLLKDNHHHTSGMAVLSNLFSSAWLVLFVLVAGFDTDFSTIPWPNVALSFVLWAITDVLLNKAVKHNEAGAFNILFTTRIFWSIMVALIFLDESFSWREWIGTLLVFVAVLMITFEQKTKWRSRPIVLGLATAFFMGIALSNDGIVLADGYDPSSFTIFTFLVPAIIIGATSKEGRASVKDHFNSDMRWGIIGLGFTHALGTIALFYAFQADQALSVLISLNQSQVIIVAIGAMIFLKERDHIPRRLLASGITVVGMLLILLN